MPEPFAHVILRPLKAAGVFGGHLLLGFAGHVKQIETNPSGGQQVIVNLDAPLKGLVALPAATVGWQVDNPDETPSQGVIPLSQRDIAEFLVPGGIGNNIFGKGNDSGRTNGVALQRDTPGRKLKACFVDDGRLSCQ
jgi:hypothetical protein